MMRAARSLLYTAVPHTHHPSGIFKLYVPSQPMLRTVETCRQIVVAFRYYSSGTGKSKQNSDCENAYQAGHACVSAANTC